MKNAVRNLLLLSCLLFAISYDSYTIGVDYDWRNKIPNHPKICFSGGSCYGERWEKLGSVSFYSASIFSLAAFVLWLTKKQSKDSATTILNLKE